MRGKWIRDEMSVSGRCVFVCVWSHRISIDVKVDTYECSLYVTTLRFELRETSITVETKQSWLLFVRIPTFQHHEQWFSTSGWMIVVSTSYKKNFKSHLFVISQGFSLKQYTCVMTEKCLVNYFVKIRDVTLWIVPGLVPKKYVMFRKTTWMLRNQRLILDVKKSKIDVKTRTIIFFFMFIMNQESES